MFLPLIPAIMRERVAGSTMSAIVIPARSREAHRGQQTTPEIPDMIQLDWMRRRGTGPDGSVTLASHQATTGAMGDRARARGTILPVKCDP